MTKKKNLIFIASLLIVLSLGIGTFLFAAEEINPDVTTPKGFQKILTSNVRKDALDGTGATRDAADSLVTDAIDYKPAPVWESNSTVTIGHGDVPDVSYSDGTQGKVTDFTIYLVQYYKLSVYNYKLFTSSRVPAQSLR